MDDHELEELTPREREILRLAREGLSNYEIGQRLGLTHNTVRYHLKNLHAKLLTDGRRAELTGGRRRWGWLPLAFSGWLAPTAGVVAVVAVSIGGYLGVRAANQSHGADAAVASQAAATATPTPAPAYPIPQSTIDSLRAYRDQVVNNTPPIDPDLLHRMLTDQLDSVAQGSLSDFQRNIIEDGRITLSEYTSAKDGWRSCMIAKGFQIPPLQLNLLGVYDTSFSGDDLDAMHEADHDCAQQYTGTLDLAWSGMIAPLEEKMAEVQREAYGACLVAAGYYKVTPSVDTSPRIEAMHTDCMEQIQQATGTGGGWFGG